MAMITNEQSFFSKMLQKLEASENENLMPQSQNERTSNITLIAFKAIKKAI
jgi:hypothetical protein